MNKDFTEKELEIIGIISDEIEDPGNFNIEDTYISFNVYKGMYYNAPEEIKSPDGNIILKLVGKDNNPYFTLHYKIFRKEIVI